MLYYFTESLSPESLSGCESSSRYSSELIIIRARPISDLAQIATPSEKKGFGWKTSEIHG